MPIRRSLAPIFIYLILFVFSSLVDGAPARVAKGYAQLPLAFERNEGQGGEPLSFLARARGYAVRLSAGETVLSFPHSPGNLRLRFLNSNPSAKAEPLERLPGIVNYFPGNDPSRWQMAVPTFAKIKFADVYPGIDLVYYGNERELEYDFVVRPGGNPKVIQWEVAGARLRMEHGDLVAGMAGHAVTLRQPKLYQQSAAGRQEIRGRYTLNGGRVSFKVEAYDTAKALVIDPVISYSTYLGGTSSDGASGIAVSPSGEAYIVGWTVSTNFPVTNGAGQAAYAGDGDVFVAKLNAGGTALIYATYLGGSAADGGHAIAADSSGSVYITGHTGSTDFPTTAGAFQTKFGGARTKDYAYYGDAFVAKLNANGALVYSTYLGGAGGDNANALAIDANGNAFVAGETTSSDFPVTSGAYQTTYRGQGQFYGGLEAAFVAKLNATGSALLYSTFLESTSADPAMVGGVFAEGIATDKDGNAYVVGRTSSRGFPATSPDFQYPPAPSGSAAFVTKVSANGSAVVYSLILGASDYYGNAEANAVAVDAQGSAYVTGSTNLRNFPVTKNAFQNTFGGACHTWQSHGCLFDIPSSNAFVAKINPAGTALVYSTFLGGGGSYGGGDRPSAIVVDSQGNAYVAGTTASLNFPLKRAFQDKYDCSECLGLGVPLEGFLAELNPDGSDLVFSTYLGGKYSDEIRGFVLDGAGNLYMVGITHATPLNYAYNTFPVTSGAFQTVPGDPVSGWQVLTRADGFVVKLLPLAAAVTPVVPGVVAPSARSAQQDVIVSLFGSNFTPNAVVLLNGLERPTKFVGPNQLDISLSPADFSFPTISLRVYNRLPTGEISGISAPIRLLVEALAGLDMEIVGLNGSPVPGARVSINNVTRPVSNTGKLHLVLPTSPYFIYGVTITAPGYQTATIWTRVFPAQTTSLSVVLVPNGAGASKIVQVPARADQNFDTGIEVKTGQTLVLYTRGSWGYSASPSDIYLTATGRNDCVSNEPGWTLPNGGRCGALAARIGTQPWFATGDAFAGPITASSRLYLSMNDVSGSFGDNNGSMEVTVIVVDTSICATPAPSLNMTLTPGFYIAEVRTQPGTREGYWGMEVLAQKGVLSGGLNLGGAVQETGSPASFGAFYVSGAQTVHLRLDAQVLPGAETGRFSVTVRLLDSKRALVGTEHTGITSVEFDQPVSEGFYVVEVQTATYAPRATFQLSPTSTKAGVRLSGFNKLR